jgi:hypothetical protein
MYADRVEETTTTQGTGALQLGGAVQGRRTFVTGIGSGNKCYAVCTDGVADWEIFEGTVQAGAPPTVSRDTILFSSNAGAPVNWGPGIKTVQIAPIAESFGPIGNRHSFATTGGSNGAYTLNLTPAPRSLVDGMLVWGRANHSVPSTGATLNVNSKGAKPLRTRDGTWALGTNDIVTNQVFGAIYDAPSDTFRMVAAWGLDEITMIRSFDPTTAFGPYVEAYRVANLATNMVLGGIRNTANNVSGNKINNLGTIFGFCQSNTLGAESATWSFETAQAGAVATRGFFGAGFVVGTPTGGDKGFGSINGSAVYDDNVLLTCYPLALEIHGSASPTFWDSAAHGNRHKAARRFLKNWRDWLDPRSYAKFWKERGHLPSMPSPKEWEERGQTIPTGELIQRLWEMGDTHAVHLDRLTNEIDQLREELRDARSRDPSYANARD